MNLSHYAKRKISDYFGENTFSFHLMKQHLAPDVYAVLERSVQYHEPLGADVADAVAAAMKDWALRRGVSSHRATAGSGASPRQLSVPKRLPPVYLRGRHHGSRR